MGFTDDVTVLWESRLWEADFSGNAQTVEEAGSPFEVIEGIFGDANRTAFSAEAYRQVNYVNDISYPNAQVLSEYAINGSMGESLTGYSYGVWRESYSVTKGGGITGITSAGAASVGGTGIKSTGTVRGTAITGNYYYTGTGSVANLVSGGRTISYAYGTGGSRSAYGAENTVLYTRTQATGYGYNGEYTHESLGMQYLRARYLNMATGTFLSRDTYGGTMDNILSQNRYTYVGNNPVNYTDPDGHKAVGTTIKNTFSAAAATTRKAAQEAKNQTGRAAETAVARSGNGAAAVSMATNRITRNEVNGVKQGTTQGATAVQSAGEKIVAGTKVSQDNPANNYPIKTDTNGFLQAADEMIKTYLAGKIDASPAGPWIESAASAIEQLECAAYNYCDNAVQSFIEGKDFERIRNGIDLFEKSMAEAISGGTFLVIGWVAWKRGASSIIVGILGSTVGIFGLMTATSDVGQAIQEVEYGWKGDSTTPSSNLIRDSLFERKGRIYDLTSGTVAALGIWLNVMAYPILATTSAGMLIPGGSSQGNAGSQPPAVINNVPRIGVVGNITEIRLPEGDAQLKHIFRDAKGHLPDTPENRQTILDVANDLNNYIGKDARGNDWYVKIAEDGTQIWVRTRNGIVNNAGANEVPLEWDSETGLYKNNNKKV